ncbi:MAG TPA: prepilin-type N-terminal cleavage/methylation domain-containing protein [Gammaproteobacteria bacterium]|nr:prepilin-type N-terminal cleavage/methylation domain-containing protein [Gammaproteobacteria bacterium]
MRKTGFSLIELLVAIAIIGILAGVAYPSYVDSVKKSHRADAQGGLMDFAAAMARYQSQNLTYVGAAPTVPGTPAPATFAAQIPVHSNKKTYNLTIQAVTASTYTLRATPISGGPQDGDGYLELSSDGKRGWDKDNNGSISSAEKTW